MNFKAKLKCAVVALTIFGSFYAYAKVEPSGLHGETRSSYFDRNIQKFKMSGTQESSYRRWQQSLHQQFVTRLSQDQHRRDGFKVQCRDSYKAIYQIVRSHYYIAAKPGSTRDAGSRKFNRNDILWQNLVNSNACSNVRLDNKALDTMWGFLFTELNRPGAIGGELTNAGDLSEILKGFRVESMIDAGAAVTQSGQDVSDIFFVRSDKRVAYASPNGAQILPPLSGSQNPAARIKLLLGAQTLYAITQGSSNGSAIVFGLDLSRGLSNASWRGITSDSVTRLLARSPRIDMLSLQQLWEVNKQGRLVPAANRAYKLTITPDKPSSPFETTGKVRHSTVYGSGERLFWIMGDGNIKYGDWLPRHQEWNRQSGSQVERSGTRQLAFGRNGGIFRISKSNQIWRGRLETNISVARQFVAYPERYRIYDSADIKWDRLPGTASSIASSYQGLVVHTGKTRGKDGTYSLYIWQESNGPWKKLSMRAAKMQPTDAGNIWIVDGKGKLKAMPIH